MVKMMSKVVLVLGCLVASSVALFFVSSPDVPVHGPIPKVYSCGTADYPPYGYGGESISIPLLWGSSPKNTKSVVLVMYDMDTETSLGFSYLHWLITDLPNSGQLLANASALKLIPGSGKEQSAYVGVCPSSPEHHIYRFIVYARRVSTTQIDFGSNPASADNIIAQLEDSPDTIAYAEYSGMFPAFPNYTP